MVTYAPFAILLGACAAIVFAFLAFWKSAAGGFDERAQRARVLFERAGWIHRDFDAIGMWAIASAALWLLFIVFVRPPLLFSVLLIPLCFAGVGGGVTFAARIAIRRRTARFVDQLELALRLVSSGLRAGLGLRQSLSIVIEEMPNPARYEFARVIGQANIGVSLYDALDDLAQRMETNESLMLARILRIQSRTGGDLARILDLLAATIKDRRRMARKISAVTSESRASALVLGALPIVVGTIICLTQHDIGTALLTSGVGHATLFFCLILELAGVLTLRAMMKGSTAS